MRKIATAALTGALVLSGATIAGAQENTQDTTGSVAVTSDTKIESDAYIPFTDTFKNLSSARQDATDFLKEYDAENGTTSTEKDVAAFTALNVLTAGSSNKTDIWTAAGIALVGSVLALIAGFAGFELPWMVK